MVQVLAVAEAHGRSLLRRRSALVLLALLPLAFYAALAGHTDRAITVGGVASAFSGGGAAVFSRLAARGVDRRLVLAGYRPFALVLGRLVVLQSLGLVLSTLTATVMVVGTSPSHPGDVFLGVALVGAVAVPLGLALGAGLAKEMEATLVLIGVVGIQLTVDSGSTLAKALPFHAASQLLDAGVGGAATPWANLLLGVSYGGVLLVLAWALWARRASLRPASPNRPLGLARLSELLYRT
jgi:hypothetical protein